MYTLLRHLRIFTEVKIQELSKDLSFEHGG